LSHLVPRSEILNHALEGREISKEEIISLYKNSKHKEYISDIFKTAHILRIQNKKNIITFSKKAFFNIINLCRDTCSYCTYKAEPTEREKLSLMSKQNVLELVHMAKRFRCVEALFVTGESPEDRYKEARGWLHKNGFSSTVEYLVYCSEIAIENGLYPHTNAGNLTKDQLRELKKTNPSMGLMLENSSQRLSEKGMPHYLAPSKRPDKRIKVLQDAGELKIPMTTGILVGIGETIEEVIDSVFTIRDIHKKYNHIQEIILQNFQPKSDTQMAEYPSAQESYFKLIVALTRIIMPDMNIQIPPNLSPRSYQEFITAGINDWGGISPFTPDYVNPEFSWPQIAKIEDRCKEAGFDLQCRFPVYPEYFDFIHHSLREKMSDIQEENTRFVKKEYWR
jgi:7,8-didemethyl-8-hydroxy-5-deazariboflavin synthase CofG subunit